MRLTSGRPGAANGISGGSVLTPLWACVGVAAALLATFQLDRLTGSAPFQHLYYVPIVFAAFRLGWRGGLATALAAIALYHLANPILLTFRYGQADVVQITLFIAIALVTARLTADARRLSALAMTDDLTGLHSLRSFEARLKTMIRDSDKAQTPLSLLVLDAGRVVARQRLMQEVWDEHYFGSTRTLDMHISSLRKKLGDDPTNPRLITTVRGVGFRFETG